METAVPDSERTPEVAIDLHANNFDFLRYLFACMVIFFHAIQNLYSSNQTDWLWQYTQGRQDPGSLAVDGFFAISGFLITASWLHSKSPADFVKRRFLRIYPGFIAVVLLTILVIGPLGGATLPYFWQRSTTQNFVSVLWLQNTDNLLPNVFRHNPQRYRMCESLWTIRYEIICYALVILLGWGRVLRWRSFVLILFVLSMMWYNHIWDPPKYWWIFDDFDRFPRVFCFFLAGMSLFLYRDRIRYTPWLALPALGLLAAIPFVWLPAWHWALPICFPYLLFWLAFSPRLKLHGWAKYGDFSYGVYLYGSGVLQLLIHYFPHRWVPFPLGVFACIVATGVAALSWHLVEKPALAWKNRSLPPLPAFLRYTGTGISKSKQAD